MVCKEFENILFYLKRKGIGRTQKILDLNSIRQFNGGAVFCISNKGVGS